MRHHSSTVMEKANTLGELGITLRRFGIYASIFSVIVGFAISALNLGLVGRPWMNENKILDRTRRMVANVKSCASRSRHEAFQSL